MAMANTTQLADQIRKRRDSKIEPVFKHLAPVWLVSEKILEQEEAILFNLMFREPTYGWLNRRYRYDAFNDVLYHMGERRLSETEALTIQQQESPYLEYERHLHQ